MENTISYCQEPTRIERIFVERLLEHVVAKGSFEGMTNKTSHDFTWPLKHEGLLSLPSICNTNSLITKENSASTPWQLGIFGSETEPNGGETQT